MNYEKIKEKFKDKLFSTAEFTEAVNSTEKPGTFYIDITANQSLGFLRTLERLGEIKSTRTYKKGLQWFYPNEESLNCNQLQIKEK